MDRETEIQAEKIRNHYYSAEQSWGRGWRQGYVVGTLVTTALLGGAVAFVFFIDWLGKCA